VDRKKIQRIKLIIAIFVILIIAGIVIFRIYKYQKEGEKNMPFNISKIIVISTVTTEDYESEESEDNSVWKFNLIQNNDVYISFENNTQKDEKIKNISIQNLQILEAPKVGTLKMYMPNSLEGNKYNYTDDFLVNDSLTYRGADENNFQYLQIAKNGGNIGFSLANKEIGKYTSGEDTEITYNATMLSKLGLTDEDVKSKVSFDVIIELDDGKEYSGNVVVDIDCDQLVENGITEKEITDFSDVIFKRI
jgi:hypothetical protein